MRPVVVNQGNGFYPSSSLSSSSSSSSASVCWTRRMRRRRFRLVIVAAAALKVMISGAPGSGKGTQSQLIADKLGLVHISIDDDDDSPDVIGAVRERVSEEDAREKGWVLDGYPRTVTQARALPRPDIFIQLHNVPDATLIQRCIGRRIDPLTSRIYHLDYSPPETQQIRQRLVASSHDTPHKVKLRLEMHKKSAEAVSSTYLDILKKVDGNRSKVVVFEEVASLLLQVQKAKKMISSPGNAAVLNIPKVSSSSQDNWRGIPTRLNNIPHTKEIRTYFYDDVLSATKRAVEDGKTLLKVEINIPELNPEMDVYRIGTLMELARVLSLSFADDGKRVKVCVQGSMGEGALAGIPLQLAGTRKILEFMDWGDSDAIGTSINIGSIGAKEVDEKDDLFILIAPQNAVGNCIIDDLKGMTDAAGNRPVVLINPRLKDLPASSGIMQTMGRDKRLEYAASFEDCYSFRLLYYAGTQYPIMGALRMSYPYRHELYKRVNEASGKEKYVILATFPEKPSVDEINDAFDGKSRTQGKRKSGIWELMMDLFS